MNERCQARVYPPHTFQGTYCSRKAWKDGWCKQHHPDSVRKRREEADKQYAEKRKKSVWYRLEQAHQEIKVLKAALTEIRDGTYDSEDQPRYLADIALKGYRQADE